MKPNDINTMNLEEAFTYVKESKNGAYALLPSTREIVTISYTDDENTYTNVFFGYTKSLDSVTSIGDDTYSYKEFIEQFSEDLDLEALRFEKAKNDVYLLEEYTFEGILDHLEEYKLG